MPSAEQTIHTYAAAITALDTDAFVACFAPNCELNDPVGAPPSYGQDGARAFFTGFLPLLDSIEFRPVTIFAASGSAAYSWVVEATGKAGQSARAEGIDVFEFDADGKILRSFGYWNPGPFVAALTAA